MSFFEKAKTDAINGDPEAQCYIGTCYAEGAGVGKDLSQAVYWFAKSAEQGFAKGQLFLSKCYFTGQGVSANPQTGLDWLQKAVAQGDEEAKEVMQAIMEMQ